MPDIYIFNSFFIRPLPVSKSFFLLKFLSVCLIYISIRMMTDKQQRTGSLSIAIIGTLEAVLVILQNYGWVESEHLLFNCTGSFFNPSLAGGFLACSFCISVYLLIITRICFKKICLFISGVLQINALVLTHSRAGWIAAHHRIMLSFMAYGIALSFNEVKHLLKRVLLSNV